MKRQRRRVRFERHPSQVMFDPSSLQFVVTWSKCGLLPEKRLEARRDPMTWIPSVSAVATLYDRGCVPQNQIVYAAMAIGRAWTAGDRVDLDTDDAKKAAELVHDLASMCVDANSASVARDVGQAMRHLLDEMARVRFMNAREEDFEEGIVMPALEKATAECLGTEGFCTWPHSSMRRRFLFCLNRKERTPVVYTLVSLLFDTGSCPLLSLSDRRTLRMIAFRGTGLVLTFNMDNASAFFRNALSKMREMKVDGRSSLGARMTQKQLADSVADSSASTEKAINQQKNQEQKEKQ